MLRPARMCKLDFIIPEESKSNLMETLHKKGMAQVEFFGDSYLQGKKIERDAPLEKVTEISKLLLRLRKVVDILGRFEPKVEKNLVEDILGIEKIEKTRTGHVDYSDLIKRAEQLLEESEDSADEISRRLHEIETKKSGLADRIRSYERFEDMDLSLENLEGEGYVYTLVGLLPQSELVKLKEKLKGSFGKEFVFVEGSPSETRRTVGLCVMRDKREELESVLRELSFEKMRIEGEGNIKKIVANLRGELRDLKDEAEEKEKKLKSIYVKHYKDLLVNEELLEIEKHRSEIFISFGRTVRTVHMRLWSLKDDFEKVENLVKEETKNTYVMEEDLDPKEAPIALKNPKMFRPFESLTKLFALPKYNEIDPTILMAPTFCLFFGIMLTDAMYGLFLIIAGAVIWKTLSKYNESAKTGGVIVIGCGIAAVFFGVLTGSYFGDMFATDLFASTPNDIALYMDPMYNGNAMVFLVIFMGMGFVHLFAGYFFGAYDSFRRGEKKKAVMEYLAWYVFVGGLGIAALTVFPSNAPLLPGIFMYVGAGIAIVGFLMLFIGVGFMTLINLIGLVGNTLSYARLLAMGLTTAGIAMSFNFLARMSLAIPYIGIILAIVVFISGHLINILINSLGAFVHSLRLHYVEHFGTYYEGGGREFKPFRENRRYTYV